MGRSEPRRVQGAGAEPHRDKRDTRREPQPHIRLHGYVLARARGLHGDRGLRHGDTDSAAGAEGDDVYPRADDVAVQRRACAVLRRGRRGRNRRGLRRTADGRSVPAARRRLSRHRDARLRRDNPRHLHEHHARHQRRARPQGHTGLRESRLELFLVHLHDICDSQGCAPSATTRSRRRLWA